LAAQSYQNLEVIVVDDGSTSPVAVRVFDEQRELYPNFRFVRQRNGGVGAARNPAPAEAKGGEFLPPDAGNVGPPRTGETFVRGMCCNPDLCALSCFNLGFRDSQDIAQGNFMYAYRPAGGPYALAGLQNVYGDANSIFRVADLRAIGGYETDRDSTCEDWET